MPLYYSITDVLDQVEKTGDGSSRLHILIPVSDTIPKTSGRTEDVFQLSSHPKLLNLTKTESAQDFMLLLENAPLYAINLELALDRALTERHMDKKIDEALRRAFGKTLLPVSMAETGAGAGNNALRHPMLGHIDKLRLCEIYIDFINALVPFHRREFGFESDILGKHAERFAGLFEGFVSPQGSKVRASILLAFGIRLDHDPGKPLESYVSAGRKKAIKMRIHEPQEMLWAWLEADNHQMRRCRDLDRTLRLEGLPRRPNWVRYDIFALLEKEAVKQQLAENYLKAEPDLAKLAMAPAIARAVRANAEGRVEEALQQLLSQTLNVEGGYSGAALRFADSAALREKEAMRLGTHYRNRTP